MPDQRRHQSHPWRSRVRFLRAPRPKNYSRKGASLSGRASSNFPREECWQRLAFNAPEVYQILPELRHEIGARATSPPHQTASLGRLQRSAAQRHVRFQKIHGVLHSSQANRQGGSSPGRDTAPKHITTNQKRKGRFPHRPHWCTLNVF